MLILCRFSHFQYLTYLGRRWNEYHATISYTGDMYGRGFPREIQNYRSDACAVLHTPGHQPGGSRGSAVHRFTNSY
jgi:hypothetical protein